MKMFKMLLSTTTAFTIGFMLNCYNSKAQDNTTTPSDENIVYDVNNDGIVNVYDLTAARKLGNEKEIRAIANFLLNIPDDTTPASTEVSDKKAIDIFTHSLTPGGYPATIYETSYGEKLVTENTIDTDNSMISIDLSTYVVRDSESNKAYYSEFFSGLSDYPVTSVTYTDNDKAEIAFQSNDGIIQITVNVCDSRICKGDSGVILYHNYEDDLQIYLSYYTGKIMLFK